MTPYSLNLRMVWFALGVWLAGSAFALDHFSTAWGTYVGGEYGDPYFPEDKVNAIVVDSSSFIYMGGTCPSYSIQHKTGDFSFQRPGFAAKASPAGELLWVKDFANCSNYDDEILALAATPSTVFAAGHTLGSSAGQGTYAFIAALGASNGAYGWHKSIGNSGGTNQFNAVTVTTNGFVYAVGHTSLPIQTMHTTLNSPAGGTSHCTNLTGGVDAFVVKFATNGVPLWCRYLGGVNDDSATAVAIGPDGHIYVAGQTCSPNWVSLAASGTANTTNSAGFIVKLTDTGTHVWSSFLNGKYDDAVTALRAVSGAGGETVLFLGGTTDSSDFLGSAANLGTAYAGGTDGFITRVTDTNTAFRIDWRRFTGGATTDRISSLDLLADGRLVAGGTTDSGGWLTLFDGSQTYHSPQNGIQDGFVTLLNSTNGALSWTSYIGGSNDDQLHALAADADTFLTAGHTFSGGWVGGGFWDEWNKSDIWGVDPYSFSFGFAVKWKPGSALPPTITLDPVDRTVQEGAPVTFTVAASGTAPFSYRWLRNGTLLPGATLSNLTFTAAFADSNAVYHCEVSNVAGTTASSGATLTVTPMGTLSVNLSPADAVARGARWRLGDDPTWRSSGTTNLPVDTYAISFTNIPGWIAPASTNAQITHAATNAITGTYTPILPEAARAIAGTNVALTVTAPAGLSSWTLTEILSEGLIPANITPNGTWDSGTRTLTFTGPDATTNTLSYSVSSASSGVYTVTGTIKPEFAPPVPVTGDNRIINAKIIRIINGTSVTITVDQPVSSRSWYVDETIPAGLTPVNVTGPNDLWENGILSWAVLRGVGQTLTYEIEGAPGTYMLSGIGNVTGSEEPIFGDTVLTIPGEEPPPVDIPPPPDILAFTATPSNTFMLTFISVTNQAYMILTNSALDNPTGWAPCLTAPVPGDDGATQHEVDAIGPRLFYRVQIDE